MAYIPDATIAAFRGSFNLGVFFRLGTVPALHLSFLVNDVPMQMPGLDAPETVYTGAGVLQNIPDLETLVNGIADTVTFTIGGLDPTAVALMFDDAPEVLGAPVTIGIAPMDARWQPSAPIALLWTGTADFISEAMAAETDPTKARTQTISLSTSTGDQSRQFQNLLTFSDNTQQMLHPGDNFCSRTPRYTASTVFSWPRY